MTDPAKLRELANLQLDERPDCTLSQASANRHRVRYGLDAAAARIESATRSGGWRRRRGCHAYAPGIIHRAQQCSIARRYATCGQ